MAARCYKVPREGSFVEDPDEEGRDPFVELGRVPGRIWRESGCASQLATMLAVVVAGLATILVLGGAWFLLDALGVRDGPVRTIVTLAGFVAPGLLTLRYVLPRIRGAMGL